MIRSGGSNSASRLATGAARSGSVSVRARKGTAPAAGSPAGRCGGSASADLDGLPTGISRYAEPQLLAGGHPNGVLAIDHVVAISPDLDRTVGRLQRGGTGSAPRARGADARRARRGRPSSGSGREILEVVAEPEEVTERAGGSDRPAIFWGLALLTPDLDRATDCIRAPPGRAARRRAAGAEHRDGAAGRRASAFRSPS